jgi:diketogulonate reductase-like aldo/keto reductase
MIKSLSDGIELLCGARMPVVGLGLYKASPEKDETYNAVRWALDAGYRHIDTARFYRNESEVGRAIKDSKVLREEIFVTSKLWITDYASPLSAFKESLKSLGSDYMDACLLHWPGTDEGLRFKAWEALLEMVRGKKLFCAGVSNFLNHHINELIGRFGVVPSMNQIELHPWRQQRESAAYCGGKGIQIVSWGPIFHGHLGEEPLMAEIAGHYGVSPAQATLRWHLQKGFVIIPKSVHKERIIQNAQLFDFELSGEDMRAIDTLDGRRRFASNEDFFNGVK